MGDSDLDDEFVHEIYNDDLDVDAVVLCQMCKKNHVYVSSTRYYCEVRNCLLYTSRCV